MSVSTEELTAALGGERVQRIERRPSMYETSYPLEDVDATLADGTALPLVLKDLNPDTLPERVRAAKPAFLLDPERELEAYGELLPPDIGTPHYYARGAHWLLIERVDGVPLWQIGELETWRSAARWLAALHERFAVDRGWRERAGHLLRYDADLYRVWARRAREHASAAGIRRRDRERVVSVVERYETLIDRLAALPATFIHGEFYASNVIVAGERICPIDWELAADGPGLLDVAALSTGKWGPEERETIASAYLDSLTNPPAAADFHEAVDCCRLNLAIQWLGWAPGWKPPRAHRFDWLREASKLVERLDL